MGYDSKRHTFYSPEDYKDLGNFYFLHPSHHVGVCMPVYGASLLKNEGSAVG